jgi:hypothetical protein
MNNDKNESPFGEVIFSYTRKQALADGVQVDVSESARQAGIKYPTFLTRTVFDKYVTVPPGVTDQEWRGRLWDIMWMTRHAIKKSQPGAGRIVVELYVRNDNRAPKLVKLVAVCAALDVDDPAPAITILLPDED